MNKEKKQITRANSSWANGLFYLSIFVAVIVTFTWAAGQTSFVTLALIIFAGILLPPLIGALQLRNDDRFSEQGFIELMGMIFKQLPLIQQLSRSTGNKQQ